MAWSDFFTSGQTSEEAAANYAAQKAKLQAQVDARAIDPYYIPTQQDVLDLAAINGTLEDKNKAASAGFVEGLGDGLKNVKDAVTGFGPFKLVPAWVWIVAAIVAFVWVGGVAWSRGRLK